MRERGLGRSPINGVWGKAPSMGFGAKPHQGYAVNSTVGIAQFEGALTA